MGEENAEEGVGKNGWISIEGVSIDERQTTGKAVYRKQLTPASVVESVVSVFSGGLSSFLFSLFCSQVASLVKICKGSWARFPLRGLAGYTHGVNIYVGKKRIVAPGKTWGFPKRGRPCRGWGPS